ncbi:hypothetical protein Tco_1548797 [Tanacetum coccineum]
MSDRNDEFNKKKNHDYVYAKYGNSWKESDEVTDEMLADLYNYAMLKESRKLPTAVLFDVDTGRISIRHSKTKEYHSECSGKITWIMCRTLRYHLCSLFVNNKLYFGINFEDEIADVILEDLWMKYGKDDKGKENEAKHDQLKVNKDDKGKRKVHDLQSIVEKLKVYFTRAIKVKHVEHDKGKGKVHELDDLVLDDLDLENKIKKLEVNFGKEEKGGKAGIADRA